MFRADARKYGGAGCAAARPLRLRRRRGDMNEHPVILRRSLHDELATRLRDMVVEGELKPAQKIPEAELCERFGVSRTPMREALKVLAREGLINLLPNRGAGVAKVTVQEIKGLRPRL